MRAGACIGGLLLLAGALCCVSSLGEGGGRRAGPRPGQPAPALDLSDARGIRRGLHELRGHPVLLSFISLPPSPRDVARRDANRSQVVFLCSMKAQYERWGLKVLIVDASVAARGERTDAVRLINLEHDWELGAIALLNDHQGQAALSYGVKRFPTTFLMDERHVVRHSWEGFVPAQQLAATVESVLRAKRPAPEE